jgi:signal peptidase I
VPPYTGYTYANPAGGGTYLFKGQTLTVPPGTYFAMGDNSSNSFDGRYWGFVPAADVIGRPLFVYYPFTHRWGPAR